MANTNFINECKNRANANRLGKIKIEGETTSTGNTLNLSECLEKNINKLSLYGRCEQKTRSGKNIFDKSKEPDVLYNLSTTQLDDGIRLTVTDKYAKQAKYVLFDISNYIGKTIRMKCDFALSSPNSSFTTTYNLGYTNSSGSIWSGIKTSNKSGNELKITVSESSTYKYIGISFELDLSYDIGEYVDFTNIIVTVDNEDMTYEDYGIIPTPDNPSEIKSIKGINLLKGLSTPRTNTDYWNSLNAVFTPLEDGWGRWEYDNTNGTSTSFMNTMVNLSAIDLKTSTTYTFVVEIRNSTISESSSAYLQVITNNATGAFKTGRLIGYQDINNGKKIIFNSTTKDSFNGVTRGVDTYLRLGAGTKGTVEARISLFEYDNAPETSNYIYIPYNTIQVKNVGKNLFNGIFELGIINGDTGKSVVNDNYIRNKNYIPVKELTNYKFSSPNYTGASVFVYEYKEDFSYNLTLNKTIQLSSYLTTNKDTKYIRFRPNIASTDTNMKFQLEEGTQSTSYEPYKENALNIDLQGNELCSLPNNIKDELIIENGRAKIIKRIGKWVISGGKFYDGSTWKGYYLRIEGKVNTADNNILCDRAIVNKTFANGTVYENQVNVMFVGNDSDTLETLKSKYDGATLYFELATSTEIDLGAIEQPKTFEGVNNISNSENTDMSVTYSNWNKIVTNSDNLQNFEIDSGCYINGNIIGSVYAKCLKVSLVADTSKLADKNIQAQIGVKYTDLSNEYINLGKYTTEHQNSEITANMSQITAYSDLYTKLDDKYVSNIDYNATNEDGTLITRTVSDLYIDVCNQLGLVPASTIFTNSDIPISDNPFTNGEKNRIVLQTISKIACAFVDIDVDTNKIDLCWLSSSEEPDYIFYKNDYSNVDGGQVICGPINCLIIKNSQVDDENVTIKDDDDIALNGEHSIIISEDYILYNAELRQQAITSIWNKVKGMKYVDCKLTTYYGKPFLKLGDKIRVYTSATEYFDTYVLKHNFKYDGSFTSVIESPALTEQEIKTKQDITLSEALKNTEISINKQNQKIELISKKSDDTSEQMSNLTQTVNGFDMTIKDVQKELNSASGKVQTLEGTIIDMNFNFSTKGLSIGTSSDSNNSLLDNTGIRVYNYNKLNAIFNNKGSGIDKLIVTGTAQIGYLKFVKSVKNNKKVTKIYHLKELIEDLEDLEV